MDTGQTNFYLTFWDKLSLLRSSYTTAPASTLKKKQCALADHFVREGVARDEWRTAYLTTDENVADLFTRCLSGLKRWKFVRMILHHVFPENRECPRQGLRLGP